MKRNFFWAVIAVLYIIVFAHSAVANFSDISSNTNIYGHAKAHSWLDYDNDKDLDLFLANGYYGGMANYLLENIGNGNFKRIILDDIFSPCSGGFSWSNAFGDYDNDGDPDIFVGNIMNGDCDGTLFLYKNNGDGTFEKLTDLFPDRANAMGASWGDYNNDGFIDLCVADSGQNNYVYKNNGDGSFTKIYIGDASEDERFSSSCIWGDYNNDGFIDLFFTRRRGKNILYKNKGDGSFTKVTNDVIVNDEYESDDASWGDYNNDGYLDIFVVNSCQQTSPYTPRPNQLYKNNGDETFSRVDNNIFNTDIRRSHGVSWGDYDNDGYLDLLIANSYPGYNNYLYKNNGDGTFIKITEDPIVIQQNESEGCSFADFNNDGFIDAFVGNWGSNEMFQNNGNNNNWINLQLEGIVSNKSAIGAKVRIRTTNNGTNLSQLRVVGAQTSGGHGQNSLNAEFGLGSATNIDEIKIEWPSGIIQVLENIPVNQFIIITENSTINQPPTIPILSSPSNSAVDIALSNVVLQWNPSTDPDGDSIEYCVTVNEDGDPDDVSVFTGCDDEIFTSETSFSLPDYSISLAPGKTYWWAVWAKDSQGNWSEASEWWSFSTAEFIFLEGLNSLFPASWYDGRVIYQHNRESIFSIIQNCLSDPSYTYSEGNKLYVDLGTNEWIRNNYSLENLPIAHILNEGSFITPWLDASWDNLIDSYTDPRNKFNTVYRGNPQANEKFEVISRIDEGNTPFDGTDNVRSYFFTYDTRTDLNGVATTLDEWVNYLAAIIEEYGRPIDILTIFAHGFPGEIQMSEAFHFKSDAETQRGMERLRSEGILAPCATILLFSCDVGQDKDFVQNLANWSGATVYANSVSTGNHKKKCREDGSCVVTRDWDLDIVKFPDNFIPCEDTLEAPLRANDDITFMFPGGITVEIAEDTLNNDGIMLITNTLNNLEELGIDTEGMTFLAAYDILLEGTVIKDQAYITVTFPYNSDIGNISASDINLKFWDEELQEWSDTGITDVLVNEEDHFVTFKTSHTTVFAVLTADTTPPEVEIDIPQSNDALQDSVTFKATASDNCGVSELSFSIREPGGTDGIPIGYEDLAATLNSSGRWVYNFNITLLSDGYYVLLAKAIDENGNEGWSELVPFSIRNWAVIQLLPASETYNAGRTMPVKFSLRIAAAVDPAQPFVYNEDLEIRIYDTSKPDTLLQTSLYGDTNKDYRIDTNSKLYITNFGTDKKPMEYSVEIWRTNKNFLIDSFTFETTKK